MPIYEFRCKDCGNVSEFQMKMSDPNPEVCPTCGHPALTKIMSLPSFQLKGGGWYSDAYDGKSNKPGSSKGAESPNSEAAPAPAAAGTAATPSAPSASPAAAPSSSGSSSGSGSTPSGSSNK